MNVWPNKIINFVQNFIGNKDELLKTCIHHLGPQHEFHFNGQQIWLTPQKYVSIYKSRHMLNIRAISPKLPAGNIGRFAHSGHISAWDNVCACVCVKSNVWWRTNCPHFLNVWLRLIYWRDSTWFGTFRPAKTIHLRAL